MPAHSSPSNSFLAYLAEFRGNRSKVLLGLTLALIKHSPVVILPIYSAYLFDHVIPEKDMVGVALVALGMASLIVMNLALHPLYIRVYSQARRDVAQRLRAQLCERLQQLVLAFHDKESSGRLHSKVMQDVEKLDQLGQILIDPVAVMIASAVASFIILLVVQPMMLLVLLVFVPLMLLQRRLLQRRVEKEYRSLRVEQEKLNAEVSEMITMLSLSRAHATEKEDLEKVSFRLEQVRDVGVRTDWMQHVMSSQLWATSQFIHIAVVALGALLAILGRMTLGEIVLAMSLVMMTLGGLNTVIGNLPQFFAAGEAMKSIHEILGHKETEQNEGKPELPALKGRIEFRDVWFAYPGTQRPALRSITLTAEPNRTIALVGPSGAGKTSFIKLLLGFYDPIQGSILVDDHDLQKFDRRTFRRQVGIVTQETFLFNGTIRQNLTHGLTDVSNERVREALVGAHAMEFVEALDNGLETEIGDRGLRLSGGQKQRLAIARALLRDPRLLILDEATSALDSQNERAVQEALQTLMKGRTTFVIAHRLSTIRNSDTILVFDEGKIVETGNHDVLLQQGGLYAKLVELQDIG